ncbi:hypothetical protein LXL04_035817 [Taraxacum kok-saghyz]
MNKKLSHFFGFSITNNICCLSVKMQLRRCSYYQNSVAVWVADTSLIEQHGDSILKDRVVSPRISTISSDDDTKDIKNIYVASKFKHLLTIILYLMSSCRPSTTKLDIEGVSISAESNVASIVAKFQKASLWLMGFMKPSPLNSNTLCSIMFDCYLDETALTITLTKNEGEELFEKRFQGMGTKQKDYLHHLACKTLQKSSMTICAAAHTICAPAQLVQTSITASRSLQPT